jgi:hypothetical protein
MDDSMMLNPASKIHQRRFLKRGSIDNTTESEKEPRRKLTYKAVAIRRQKRSLSP